MITKIDQSSAIVFDPIRDNRSESVDSIGSTVTVDISFKNKTNSSTSDEPTSSSLSYFDIDYTAPYDTSSRELIFKFIESIVVLDSHTDDKVQNLLDSYNGHLINIGLNLLKSLRDAAPIKLAARVGDFNGNLFYEMQGHKKDVKSIISQTQSTGWSANRQLEEDIQWFEASLRETLNHDKLTYRGSFMRTEQTIYQPAHVDYDYLVLNEHGEKLFLAFFPLTEEGTFLQLWDRTKAERTVKGTVVYIPHGKMLILPANTIHGGGFKKGKSGNLRFHLYIELQNEISAKEIEKADVLNHPVNKYTEEHDCRRELCDRFIDADGLEHLVDIFFDG